MVDKAKRIMQTKLIATFLWISQGLVIAATSHVVIKILRKMSRDSRSSQFFIPESTIAKNLSRTLFKREEEHWLSFKDKNLQETMRENKNTVLLCSTDLLCHFKIDWGLIWAKTNFKRKKDTNLRLILIIFVFYGKK